MWVRSSNQEVAPGSLITPKKSSFIVPMQNCQQKRIEDNHIRKEVEADYKIRATIYKAD